MNKSAKAAIEKPISDAIAKAIEEAKADSDLNFLKKQKEAQEAQMGGAYVWV